jgi:hypothetical protein
MWIKSGDGHDASRLPRVPGSSFEFTRSTDIAIRAVDGISSRSAPTWAGEEKPRLFENRPDHNPPREPTREGDFLIFIAVTL